MSILTSARASAFLFPGQGSQHVGMAQQVCATSPAARRTMEEANDILGFDLTSLCFSGPDEVLTDTINAQPALLATSIAILRALEEALGGSLPALPDKAANVAAGHSMGEYSALVAAESLTFADGLRLVRERGRLMKEAGEQTPGMMAAILGLDQEQVAQVCLEATAQGGIAQIANDNCPGQIVISGDRTGMEAAMAALAAAGARKVVPLAVSIAAHSPLMQPAAEGMAAALADTTIAAPRIAVFGNTTAQPLTTADAVRAELMAQLTGSVRWTESVQSMLAAGATTFVEVGAGEVLAGLVKRIDRGAARYSLNTPESVEAYAASL